MKIAKVIPILKSGDMNDLNNYRPISLLPSFSKIFEKVIAKRMINFFNKLDLIFLSQFGFRNKHSTDMALIKLYDTISEAIGNLSWRPHINYISSKISKSLGIPSKLKHKLRDAASICFIIV